MALKLMVLKNHLPACPDPFVIRSNSVDVVEYDELVDKMARGRTTLTKTDLLGSMQLFKETVIEVLAEGRTVKTPTGSFYLSAGGSLANIDDSFLPRDPNTNHDIRLHHRAERSFEDAILASLKVVREDKADLSLPFLRTAEAANGVEGGAIVAGGLLLVKGSRLAFDVKDPRQGLFYLAEDGGETRAPYFPVSLPASIMAAVPAELPAGSYSLAVRTAPNGKDIREGRYDGVVISGS